MTVAAPIVGQIVQFFPGRGQRNAGYGPRAAIVTGVSGSAPDWGVSLTVFHVDGTTAAVSRALHRNTWAASSGVVPGFDADGVGYWAWPPGAHV